MTRPAKQLLEMVLHFVLAVALTAGFVALMLTLLPGNHETGPVADRTGGPSDSSTVGHDATVS